MLMEFFDRYAREYQPYKNGAWCYEDGLIYRGLTCLHSATGDEKWIGHLERLISPQMLNDKKLLGYDPNDYNIDNVLSGRALLYLFDVTGQRNYLEIARLLVDQLATHPRTHSGIYWHKLRYPWQVWLDGLYMGLPFQIEYALDTEKDPLIVDALAQVTTALKIAYVPTTKLYSHAFDEARKQPWADFQTGHTRAHWARAIGWLTMALVDIADLVGSERYRPLAMQTKNLLQRVVDLRRSSGLWLQVIDRPDLEGNYEESSASAMFVYALLKARRLGFYDGDVNFMADDLIKRTLYTDTNGKSRMVDMCHVAGLGMYQGRFRDGTAEYYISERRVDNDPKGVGPLMMAAAERFSQNNQSIPELFNID